LIWIVGITTSSHGNVLSHYYVYILQSSSFEHRYYVGFTEDLESRLKDHNAGKLPNTNRYKPWKIKSAHAFATKSKALSFEAYLKTPSGRAFAKKHL
jgi:predicted GIY-YIG superfamily endonuclease